MRTIEIQLEPAASFRSDLTGIVDALLYLIRPDLSENERVQACAISSASFAQYVYDPTLNALDSEVRPFSSLGNYFSNFGVYEALGRWMGYEIRVVEGLSPRDTFRVTAHELEHGRGLVTLMGDESNLRPMLITGASTDGKQFFARIRDGKHSVTADLKHDLQSVPYGFDRWMLMVRPAKSSHLSRSQHIRNVLSWTIRHNRSTKEFIHEVRENYAPGLRAFQALQELQQVEDAREVFDVICANLAERKRRASMALTLFQETEDLPIGDAAEAFMQTSLAMKERNIERARSIQDEAITLLEEAFPDASRNHFF